MYKFLSLKWIHPKIQSCMPVMTLPEFDENRYYCGLLKHRALRTPTAFSACHFTFMPAVLGLAEMALTFFIPSLTVLCFRSVTTTVLTTPWCFSYCWTALHSTKAAPGSYSVPSPPVNRSWEGTQSGRWPKLTKKRYSMSRSVMLSNKMERREHVLCCSNGISSALNRRTRISDKIVI